MTAKPTYSLVGAGGTGSIIFPQLLHYLGAWHRNRKESFYLQVIDGDEVETKNFDRQLFGTMATGHNKANALVETSTFVPDNAKIFAVPHYLGKKNIDELVRRGDIVLIAVDNYSVRALIEARVKALEDAVVINGGNELTNGSCQIYIRQAGKNVTPPLSHFHEEIKYKGTDDRAAMTCAARTKIPGGEQTIAANSMSASIMLAFLSNYHTQATKPKGMVGHEAHFDLATLAMRHEDLRGTDGWK